MAEMFLTMSRPAFDMLLRKNPVAEAPIVDKRPGAYRYSKVRTLATGVRVPVINAFRIVFKVRHEIAA